MMMNNCPFEIPKPYPFVLNLKNIVALLRYVIIIQTYPIYVVLKYYHKVSMEHHFTKDMLRSLKFNFN